MKLTQEQLKNLIKEEASKIRKEMQAEKEKAAKKTELETRKVEIMSQLNEMYGEDVQEIFGLQNTKVGQALGMKTPEQKAQAEQAYEAKVMAHPVAKMTLKNAMAKGMQQADATKQIVAIFRKNSPHTPKIGWDEKTKTLLDQSRYGAELSLAAAE